MPWIIALLAAAGAGAAAVISSLEKPSGSGAARGARGSLASWVRGLRKAEANETFVVQRPMTAWWRASGLEHIDEGKALVGRLIPKSKPLDHAVPDTGEPIELIFERIRRTERPEAVSRLGAVYVCPSQTVFCNPEFFRPGDALFEVEIQPGARVFPANPYLWTEAVEEARRYRRSSGVEEWARQYWTTLPDLENRYEGVELLVDGDVRIKRFDFVKWG